VATYPPRQWTTLATLQAQLSPPFTADELTLQGQAVDAANGFLAAARPDLNDPAVQPDDGDAIEWAATQVARRWLERRGSAQTSGFAELGFIPQSIDRDIEVTLRLGAHHDPVVA
jgi:hypothetical protein